jgi:hypothetical protein
VKGACETTTGPAIGLGYDGEKKSSGVGGEGKCCMGPAVGTVLYTVLDTGFVCDSEMKCTATAIVVVVDSHCLSFRNPKTPTKGERGSHAGATLG